MCNTHLEVLWFQICCLKEMTHIILQKIKYSENKIDSKSCDHILEY